MEWETVAPFSVDKGRLVMHEMNNGEMGRAVDQIYLSVFGETRDRLAA
jgi:hypothetical protein